MWKLFFFVHIKLLFFQSLDFTWAQYDKQELEREEKYFIRASVEAVTAQIHPLCQDTTHTHWRGRGSGIRVEKLSDAGFREEVGGEVLGEAVRSCRRGQIAVELQPTFIWSRHEFCCLSGVGFWFILWQRQKKPKQQLFFWSPKNGFLNIHFLWKQQTPFRVCLSRYYTCSIKKGSWLCLRGHRFLPWRYLTSLLLTLVLSIFWY